MKKIISATLTAGILIGLLTACNTLKVNSWTNPEFKGRPIGKTIVLGVSESDSLSRQYEGLFVGSLMDLGIDAASLHGSANVTGQIDKEALDALLKANHVDTIIVTRVLAETERNQVVATGYHADPYNNYYGYYGYGYSLSYNTADVVSFMEFELETNLYDVNSGKLIWSGRKVVYDDRSDLTNMKGIIKGVVKGLRKQGMID